MSDENKVNEIVTALKAAFEELAAKILTNAQGAVEEYAQQITQEYSRYLWQAYKEDNPTALRNLEHLRAQLPLIAVKHGLIARQDTIITLQNMLETAVAIGVRVLRAALAAAR